jgi:hypothetical protein
MHIFVTFTEAALKPEYKMKTPVLYSERTTLWEHYFYFLFYQLSYLFFAPCGRLYY